MSELKNLEEIDYYNRAEIEVKTKENISGDDLKIIQDASNTIIEVAKKYFTKPAPKVTKEK